MHAFFFPAFRSWLFAILTMTIPTLAFAGEPLSARDGESAFLQENDSAMNAMMAGMSIRPSGNVDRDFVAMMVPHHQGAIDMAQAELRHGHNEQLRRIAQEIIVEQQQEITAMHLALGQALPPSAPAPDQLSPHSSAGPSADTQQHNPMHMTMPSESK